MQAPCMNFASRLGYDYTAINEEVDFTQTSRPTAADYNASFV